MNILEQLIEEREMRYKGGLYRLTQIALAYNSNRIEGSTLTKEQTRYLFETRSILSEKDALEFTKLDDVVEMNNHFIMFNNMLATASGKLTEDILKTYHKILKSGTADADKDWFAVGDYKRLENEVGNITTTHPGEVSEEMENLFIAYNSKSTKTIKDIATFHVQLETIHPFQDGNGRVGRMAMFRECLVNDIAPFIINDVNKDYYYHALRTFYNEPNEFFDFIKQEQAEYSKQSKSLLRSENEVLNKGDRIPFDSGLTQKAKPCHQDEAEHTRLTDDDEIEI